VLATNTQEEDYRIAKPLLLFYTCAVAISPDADHLQACQALRH
jgi:hypothetical protein